MYRLNFDKRDDDQRFWRLPDRVFFACGACHILSYAFLERYGSAGWRPIWIRPAVGFTGNHIYVTDGQWAFDYHGYSRGEDLLAHTFAKAERWWPRWRASVVELTPDVLISESKSKTFDGLWLREPGQFRHNPLPRARAFLDRFPAPPQR